jgi:peroxiredoxin
MSKVGPLKLSFIAAALVATWAGRTAAENVPVIADVSTIAVTETNVAQKTTENVQPNLVINESPAAGALAQTSLKREAARPRERTAYFRADGPTPKVPKVALTKREDGLCKVKVGDDMPAISLPQIGGSDSAKLSELLGKSATVVVFWKSDRRMALEELADLGTDVVEPYAKDGVTVVGIAVNESETSAPEALTKAGAKFTNLLDAEGKAFAQVGNEKLPRTYVLDADGKIVWFDIEYSLTTRRELHAALRALTDQ